MTGRIEAAVGARASIGWLARLASVQHRYLAVDGGTGAHLASALLGEDPRLQRVASPRHADLLILFGPVTQKLAPSVAEVARAMPRPAHALIIGQGSQSAFYAEPADLEHLLPGARYISAIPPGQPGQIVAAAFNPSNWLEITVREEALPQPVTIRLPSKGERELASELAVLSLGPIQPFTAGPLRILLICDGEQALSAQYEAGFVYRGIAEAMARATWRGAAELARQIDPLAPFAGRLAYVQAIEQLQATELPSQATELPGWVADTRKAALALERAQNQLWWLVRFAGNLEALPLSNRAHPLAVALAGVVGDLWQQPADEWLEPRVCPAPANPEAVKRLGRFAGEVARLLEHISRARLLSLRLTGIGILAAEQLKEAGASGPVLEASERGAGDIQSRLLARLTSAVTDLQWAAERLGLPSLGAGSDSSAVGPIRWDAPSGETHVTVRGPRGNIGLNLASEGGDGPIRVEWQRPSAMLLPLLSGAFAGQNLADAEVILDSLDLAMAEADG